MIGQESGLHLLVRSNNGMPEQVLIKQAAKCSIKVYPVSTYGKSDRKTILMGFAILSVEEIQEAVRLLAEAWFSK